MTHSAIVRKIGDIEDHCQPEMSNLASMLSAFWSVGMLLNARRFY